MDQYSNNGFQLEPVYKDKYEDNERLLKNDLVIDDIEYIESDTCCQRYDNIIGPFIIFLIVSIPIIIVVLTLGLTLSNGHHHTMIQ